MASSLLLLLLLTISTVSSFAPINPSRIRTTTNLAATDTDDTIYDCLIIGGGISGSTLAHNLHSNHNCNINILLTEARNYLGGNVQSKIHTDSDGEFIYEYGPNSFATQPSIVRIANELKIDNELVFANESLPPWVNYNNKLHPLPKGKGGKGPQGQLELVFGSNGVLKFGLAGDLLSWPGKIRAGIGAFIGHPAAPKDKEETIQDWIRRTLGDEVFFRIIDPFVSGVYAGDPTTLSMKAALPKIARIEQYSYDIDWNKFGALFYGGLARQVELTKERKADPPEPQWVDFEYGNPGSFKRGLSTLPNAIEKELDDKVKLEWKLIKVIKNEDDKTYTATFDTPNGQVSKTTKSIVSTIPTHAMGNILEPVLPGSTDLFTKERAAIKRKGIYYPPVAAVTVAYPKKTFKDVELDNDFGNLQNLPGFGLLNPRSEGVRTLGHLWSSSLFPGRCPDDYNILLNYIGGSRDPEIGSMDEEDIIKAVDTDLRKVLLKPDAPEPKVLGIKVWPTAIPQYEMGHLELMKELEAMESKNNEIMGGGLWVCGNYRSGVAFPDCCTFGYEHAKVVKEFLDSKE